MQTEFTEFTDSQWEVIEKLLNDHRKRTHSLRVMMNAILWITRTGSQWRNMESKYPPWQSVFYYFRKWKASGILGGILSYLVESERERQGRNREASAGAVDSQSVKKSPFVSLDTGIDGGKKINGRKRHLLVDTLGLPLAIHVSAADVADGEGGFDLLWQAEQRSTRMELIRGDQAYAKIFAQAAAYYGWRVETAQRPESEQGFVPQTGRWQVERSFGWLNFFRRLSKDYEKTIPSSLAFIQLAFITIILARMAN
jgi:transposase